MSTLRDYLLYQTDMGLDEVILDKPWIKPNTVAKPLSPTKLAYSSEMESTLPLTYELLATSVVENKTNGLEADTPIDRIPLTPIPVAPIQEPIPDFMDLNVYWQFIETQEKIKNPTAHWIKSIGPSFAAVALISLQPNASEIATGIPYQGEESFLLDKMLRAINLDRQLLYAVFILKRFKKGKISRLEMLKAMPLFLAEMRLAKANMGLLLGEECAQLFLKSGKPLDDLRGQIHIVDGREYMATYHPSDLIAKEELKRKAWEDLKWLRKKLDENAKSL